MAWLGVTIAVVALVVVGVAGAALGRSSTASASTVVPGTITVTGTGTIQGTPDTVSFSVGIDTDAANAVLALRQNNTQMRSLEAILLRYHVAQKDLQTSNLDIYQRTNSVGTVIGWEVDDTLNVVVHNTARAGAIIDAAASVAGNGINFGGVTFSISNESAYLAQARKQAMQSAMTAATQLAAGANRTVTGIVKVTDQESYQPSPITWGDALNATSSAVPLQVGRQPVSVQVTVVYTLS